MSATMKSESEQSTSSVVTQSGGRLAKQSRLASVGLVLILLGVSIFAVWSSQATSRAARAASDASRLSDGYDAAATAVAAQESLERKYRLEPGPAVEARFDAAAEKLVTALGSVRRDGDGADRARVDTLLATHGEFLAKMEVLFRAVDRGDSAGVLRADADTEVIFDVIEGTVEEAANAQHQESLDQLAHLRRLESLNSRLTPLVFLTGLLLAAGLASVTRGYRRLLNMERTQAIHDSMHDALTGLPNRRMLADRFDQALQAARRGGTAVALLLIDLDRFKEINNTFGHHCGDLLLTQIGPRLMAELHDTDTVARLGGDEFAVVLPDVTDVPTALAVADRLRTALETSFHVEGFDVEGLELDVEASVGVVLSGQHGEDATTLLQRADIAMYVAKSENRGVFAYDPAVDGHTPAKLAMLGDLRRALDRQELVLHFQPKISIGTNEVVGAEALVRWQHPERGLLPPDHFIPLAEHTGLIRPLTLHVLNSALAQVRVWADAGRPLKVAVNLSARNLLDERLPVMVSELLALHGVPATLLELEVTESALMTEPGRAQSLLQQLAALGVGISVDDFGAGYTSLGQLKELPLSELKVDRSFVTTMTQDRSDALIVRSVVDLGHNLGYTIVAEGVETAEALSTLAGWGCDVAQGYHLARPMPVHAFDAWYFARTAGVGDTVAAST